jgi:hypothetical protein
MLLEVFMKRILLIILSMGVSGFSMACASIAPEVMAEPTGCLNDGEQLLCEDVHVELHKISKKEANDFQLKFEKGED